MSSRKKKPEDLQRAVQALDMSYGAAVDTIKAAFEHLMAGQHYKAKAVLLRALSADEWELDWEDVLGE